VWNISGLVPESSNLVRLAAALSVTTAVAAGVAACGPSGGGGSSATYSIQFTLSQTPAQLTLLEFTVDYSGGSFVGDGTDVACSVINSAGDDAVFDDDGSILSITIDAEDEKLVDDQNIVECDFQAATQPDADNFTIEIEDAEPSDPANVAVVVTSTELSSAASLGEVTE